MSRRDLKKLLLKLQFPPLDFPNKPMRLSHSGAQAAEKKLNRSVVKKQKLREKQKKKLPKLKDKLQLKLKLKLR